MDKKITTILITGPPGIGKTTLVRKICTDLQETTKIDIIGFYTEEVRCTKGGRCSRIGFDCCTLDGKRGILARDQSTMPGYKSNVPKVGKYSVFITDFENLAIPTLRSTNKNQLVVIDEIGKMELISKNFAHLVEHLLKSGQPMLISVPYQTRQPIEIVEQFKNAPCSKTFVLSKANRDSLLRVIKDNLISIIEK